ncbi:MAG TPA: hypothetical protein VF748_15155 [Candidatus Acidoferrum sp.]
MSSSGLTHTEEGEAGKEITIAVELSRLMEFDRLMAAGGIEAVMAKIKKSGTNRTVRAVANRGQQYEVVFDAAGEVVRVSTLFRRACDYRTQSRQIYWRGQTPKMSLTAACAVRAAMMVS